MGSFTLKKDMGIWFFLYVYFEWTCVCVCGWEYGWFGVTKLDFYVDWPKSTKKADIKENKRISTKRFSLFPNKEEA